MRLLLLLLLCLPVSTSAAEPNQLTPEQIRDGWISLFDGETLYGWQPTSDANWEVKDGAIHVSDGKPGFLMTTSEFADYELQLEFKAPATTNSGVFLRTPLEPKNPAKDCYEVNIAPLRDNPFPTASVVGRSRAPLELPESWAGKWHRFVLRVKDEMLTVMIDGKPLVKYIDPKPLIRGHIGLQHNHGPVAFRDIRLKPLGTKPIFNGKDLTGWNTKRAEASKFQVTPEGELQVLNGRGQLESDGEYGDFVLQLECFVNGDALNSGVFFRCIPGDFMNGYECQIHNGMKDGDPNQPQDWGTGGFYRRQPARKVMAQDREWFALTLLADGPHMATWVNGTQVNDWIEHRKPHENPRNGLRTKPGTLAIQGHDPTTDLRFRNLRVVELPR